MNQRTEFVLRALKTDNFRELCQEYGISPKTGYKWKERFLLDGFNGLKEHSRRPHRSPQGLAEAEICDIIKIQMRHLRWGPRKIRAIYQRAHGTAPSESTFKRILDKAGFTQKRPLRKRQESGRIFSGQRAQVPNDVWTADFKGWWRNTQGGRCEPLTVRDECCRFILELRDLPDSLTETVRTRFELLFEQYGLPGAIRSDNGSPFAHPCSVLGLTRLSAWWVALGIDLERGRPGCPQDNGGHERMHLDVYRELEKPGLGQNQFELDEWRREFNHERPHEALGMRTPAELYHPAKRKYEGTPEDLIYDTMASRKVHRTGTIKWEGQSIGISSALQGWSVGLEPASHNQRWNVWFGRLLLGQIETSTASFQPVAHGGQTTSRYHKGGNGHSQEQSRAASVADDGCPPAREGKVPTSLTPLGTVS